MWRNTETHGRTTTGVLAIGVEKNDLAVSTVARMYHAGRDSKVSPGFPLIKPARTFNETLNRLLGDGKPAWTKRRYVETFSPYARQFLERLDKPAAERIEGIPPAIAIDQTSPVRTSRSTVGTVTELNDHLKLLFARAAKLYCRVCGNGVGATPHWKSGPMNYSQLNANLRCAASCSSSHFLRCRPPP